MGLEVATYIDELVATNPIGGSDNVSQGDDHIRLIKSVLQATLPNLSGAMTLTDAQLNDAALKSAANTFLTKQIIDSSGTNPPLDLKSTAGAYINYYKGAAAFGAAGSGEALGGAAGSYAVYVNGAIRQLWDSSGNFDFKGGTVTTNNASSSEVGFKGVPENEQNGDYTLVLTDAGKLIEMVNVAGSRTLTIPANSSVAFPIGTVITVVSSASTGLSIAITTDTLYLAGVGYATTGTRTLAYGGLATLVKHSAAAWLISGTGLS